MSRALPASPSPPTLPLEEAVASFLRSLAGATKGLATVAAYRTHLAQLVAFFEEINRAVDAPADVRRPVQDSDAVIRAREARTGAGRPVSLGVAPRS